MPRDEEDLLEMENRWRSMMLPRPGLGGGRSIYRANLCVSPSTLTRCDWLENPKQGWVGPTAGALIPAVRELGGGPISALVGGSFYVVSLSVATPGWKYCRETVAGFSESWRGRAKWPGGAFYLI